jgi:acetyl-CoA synthetase
VLVEQMIDDGVAEVLVGVAVDAQFGQVLLIGSGGEYAELWKDTVCLLPPWSRGLVESALARLKVNELLGGFRGRPTGDVAALVDAILAIGRYAEAHRDAVRARRESDHRRPRGAGAVATC